MIVPEFVKSVPARQTDLSAAELAALAQKRWHELGYTTAKFWVETRPWRDGSSTKMIQVVRSNLIVGLPPAVEAERKAA